MRYARKKLLTGIVCLVVLVFDVLEAAKGVEETNLEEQEPLLAYLISSGDITKEMAELLLVNCRLELSRSRRTLQDVELDSGMLSRRKNRDVVLEVKKIFVDCFRDKNVAFPSTVDELINEHHSPRQRELTQESKQILKKHRATHGHGSASGVQSSNQTVILAVAVTASLTFVVSTLLFICFRKCCGVRSGRVRNDESPLLSLKLTDNSAASSQRSHGLGYVASEEKTGHQAFNNKSDAGGNFHMDLHSLSNSKSELPIGVAINSSNSKGELPIGVAINSVDILPLPPGRSPATVIPPLKPPPGRNAPLLPDVVPPLSAAAAPPRPPATAPPPPPPPVRPSDVPRPPPSGAPPPPAPHVGPRPPPPPRGGAAPPRAPPVGMKAPRPGQTTSESEQGEDSAAKAKLKPFFWDKVSANPDQSMVWHQIKAGSFQFNEEMMESLFGYAPNGKAKIDSKKDSSSKEPQFIQIIDQKKAQNLSILLKALNVTTEEVCDALEEGNELPPELIQTLLKMAPRPEEELKLRLYSGDPSMLGHAERFLKRIVDIPFAFKRLESLFFMCTLQEETLTLKESFTVLVAACTDLRKSRLFHKLLEAVLKTGNRMNSGTYRGEAQAFKLDTLLKLSDVRAADGKTTLLHFVVLEIIRSEGVRAARASREMRSMSSFGSEDLHADAVSTQDTDDELSSLGLQVVSALSNELEYVKRAAVLDSEGLTGTVAKLGEGLVKAKTFLNTDMKDVPEDNSFHQGLKCFVENAESVMMHLLEEENKTMDLVKVTADYFHGNSGKDEGLRLFVVVRDFLIILDKVCKEVKNTPKPTPKRTPKRKEESVVAPHPDVHQTTPNNKEESVAAPVSDVRQTTPITQQRLFPAIVDRRANSSSSDDSSDDDM